MSRSSAQSGGSARSVAARLGLQHNSAFLDAVLPRNSASPERLLVDATISWKAAAD